MSWQLTSDEIKVIVLRALLTVADICAPEAEVEKFRFSRFRDFHKKVFLANLRVFLLEKEYKGNCYNVALDEGMLEKWKRIDRCIDYLYENQERIEVEPKLTIRMPAVRHFKV